MLVITRVDVPAGTDKIEAALKSMNLKLISSAAKETVNEFLQDRAMRLAAATAYYAIFSLGPLLVLSVGLAGVVFGEDNVRHEVYRQMKGFVGEKSASVISSMMSVQRQGESMMAAVIGGIALLIGATGAFGQLQDSLNTIWGVTPKPGQSVGAFLRDRLFSMAMVLVVGFLLLVSMVLSTVVVAFAEYIGYLVSVPSWLVPLLNDGINLLVITLLFAMIFKVLPDVKIRWRDVWVGGAGTALLFTVGKLLLGLYLAREATASAYGAASSFVVILLYIYYASIILYLGAEFTQVYARYRGSRLEPSKYAVRITDFERAEQGMPRPQQIAAAIHAETKATTCTQENERNPGMRNALQSERGIRPFPFLFFAFFVGAATGLLWKSGEDRA